jgi:hypothetical protein
VYVGPLRTCPSSVSSIAETIELQRIWTDGRTDLPGLARRWRDARACARTDPKRAPLGRHAELRGTRRTSCRMPRQPSCSSLRSVTRVTFWNCLMCLYLSRL